MHTLSAPYRFRSEPHQTMTARFRRCFLFETFNVADDCLRQFHLCRWPALRMPSNFAHIATVKGSREGAEFRSTLSDRFENMRGKHARANRGAIAILSGHVPSAKNKILQIRERNEFFDQWIAGVRPFSQIECAGVA